MITMCISLLSAYEALSDCKDESRQFRIVVFVFLVGLSFSGIAELHITECFIHDKCDSTISELKSTWSKATTWWLRDNTDVATWHQRHDGCETPIAFKQSRLMVSMRQYGVVALGIITIHNRSWVCVTCTHSYRPRHQNQCNIKINPHL